MPVTMKDVRAVLDSEEPNYKQGAKLGAEAAPHLRELVNSGDELLAAKAAYLASLIEGAQDVVAAAAKNPNDAVRVAAAAASKNLPADQAADVLVGLMGDLDPGVRKTALKSVPAGAPERLRAAVAARGQEDVDPGIRAMSASAMRRIAGEAEVAPSEGGGAAGEGGGSVDVSGGDTSGGESDGMGGGSGGSAGDGFGGGNGGDAGGGGMGDGGTPGGGSGAGEGGGSGG